MCMVSNIGDSWGRTAPYKWPYVVPFVPANDQEPFDGQKLTDFMQALPSVSRAEFDSLKKELEELKKLLVAAKAFDKTTGQPDCSVDKKVALIKGLAAALGVDMGDVFEKG